MDGVGAFEFPTVPVIPCSLVAALLGLTFGLYHHAILDCGAAQLHHWRHGAQPFQSPAGALSYQLTAGPQRPLALAML
eukprot:8135423-Lingulodinium_polyedra.AAC.1